MATKGLLERVRRLYRPPGVYRGETKRGVRLARPTAARRGVGGSKYWLVPGLKTGLAALVSRQKIDATSRLADRLLATRSPFGRLSVDAGYPTVTRWRRVTGDCRRLDGAVGAGRERRHIRGPVGLHSRPTVSRTDLGRRPADHPSRLTFPPDGLRWSPRVAWADGRSPRPI